MNFQKLHTYRYDPGDIMRGHIAICLLAATAFYSGAAHADEIDDIMKIERMAYEETQSEKPVASQPKTGSSANPASTTRKSVGKSSIRLERELSAAREEIIRLHRRLADQEVRHRSELLHSHYNMGCVYKAARQYARAESEFLEALAISPEDPGVHFNLGILYDDDLDQKDKARYHYNKYVELAPTDRDVPRVMEWLATMGK